MVSFSNPRQLAEQQFKIAAGEAALFELRMRLTGGTIPSLREQKITIDLAPLTDKIIEHHKAILSADDISLLKQAALRNKLLHCEFSTARKFLDAANPKTRDGGVTIFKNVNDAASLMAAINQQNANQTTVASTETKTLGDIYGWLWEFSNAGEFEEAANILSKANLLIDHLTITGSI